MNDTATTPTMHEVAGYHLDDAADSMTRAHPAVRKIRKTIKKHLEKGARKAEKATAKFGRAKGAVRRAKAS